MIERDDDADERASSCEPERVLCENRDREEEIGWNKMIFREKMEREVQQRLEEKRYEQMLRLRKALIGRKPAWRALRSAARFVHSSYCSWSSLHSNTKELL